MMISINQAVLGYIVSQLKAGNLRCCEAFGLTEKELRIINNMTVNEMLYLCASSAQFFELKVNHSLLETMLDRAKNDSQEQNIIDRAISLEASTSIIKQYFGLTSFQISERRRLLNCTGAQGRKTAPSDKQSEQVWHRWQEVKNHDFPFESQEALLLMMQISEELQINLTTVWRLIKTWTDESLVKRQKTTLYQEKRY